MGAELAEPTSPVVSPQLRRQRSLTSLIAVRCCGALCCFDCDTFFTQLPAQSFNRDVHINPTSSEHKHQFGAWHESWRLLGSRRKAAVSGTLSGVQDEVVSDDLYTRPARWRLFFRKLRAGGRKMNCRRASSMGFHYDALSYAMNFDDGFCAWQQQSLYRAGSSAAPIIQETSKACVSPVS